MTPKKYTDSTKRKLEVQLQNINKKIERNDFLYNIGAIFTGVMGAFTLFGNPWFGIPLIGASGALFMGKKTVLDALKNTKSRIENEKKHVEEMVSKGLDISNNANAQRNAKYNQVGKKRKKAEQEYYSSSTGRYFANALVAGTVALAGIFATPLFGLLPLASIGVKYLADKSYSEKQETLEKTSNELNNLIHEINTSAYAIRSRNAHRAAQQQSVQQRGTQQQRRPQQATQQRSAQPTPVGSTTTRRVATPQQRVTTSRNGQVSSMDGYDPRDVAAVDAYVEQICKKRGEPTNYQKRKI